MRFLSGLTGIALHALWLFALRSNFLKKVFQKRKCFSFFFSFGLKAGSIGLERARRS